SRWRCAVEWWAMAPTSNPSRRFSAWRTVRPCVGGGVCQTVAPRYVVVIGGCQRLAWRGRASRVRKPPPGPTGPASPPPRLPPVERVGAALGDEGQAPGQVRLAQALASPRGRAPRCVDAVPLRVVEGRGALADRLGEEVGRRKAVGGERDRGLQELAEPAGA